MFPEASRLKVRTILKTSRFHANEAIQCLLKETSNDNLSVSSLTDFDDENSKESLMSALTVTSNESSKKRKFDDEDKGTLSWLLDKNARNYSVGASPNADRGYLISQQNKVDLISNLSRA
jgi:hypothetical protein